MNIQNMGVQAIRDLRTKESIKNNKLMQFVQYVKQPIGNDEGG